MIDRLWFQTQIQSVVTMDTSDAGDNQADRSTFRGVSKMNQMQQFNPVNSERDFKRLSLPSPIARSFPFVSIEFVLFLFVP